MIGEGLGKLKQGDFNHQSREELPDGSEVFTLLKRGEGKVHKFRVKGLYSPDEQEIDIEDK